MDGKKLTTLFLDAILESDVDQNFASARRIFEFLDWAVSLFCRETKAFRKRATITTAASQQSYDLPPDFLELWMTKSNGRFFVKYYDGANYSWPSFTTWERIYKRNYTAVAAFPNNFTIIQKEALSSVISGAATTAATVSGGECTLTDSTKNFITTNQVYPRDVVHNTTDDSSGFVISVTSATKCEVALFDNTTDVAVSITTGASYSIIPASEQQLMLDAPSETAAHTIEVPYVGLPSPVFADRGSWELNDRAARAIVTGAAALFSIPSGKYTDSSQLGSLFLDEIKRYRTEMARNILVQGRYRVQG